jgi:predicted ATP-grasp superfamily ATP-dependent carboligase
VSAGLVFGVAVSASPISVLIPDSDTWDALKVMRCLRRSARFRTRVLATRTAPVARFSRSCEGFHRSDAKVGSDAWLETVRGLVEGLEIGVLLPVTEAGMGAVLRHRDQLSAITALPPLPAADRFALATDKWSLHEFASGHRIPVVPTTLLGSPGGPLPPLEGAEFPALLKPTSLAGGYGILSVEDRGALERLWRGLSDSGRATGYVFQSFVPGIDLCLGMFCRKGEIVAHTVQRSLDAPGVGFGPQRSMQFIRDPEVLELGGRLARALHWDGVAYVDFRRDLRDQTCNLLEVNARFGQAVLGSLAAGVNFPLRSCLAALAEDDPDETYGELDYFHPGAFLRAWASPPLARRGAVRPRLRQSGLQFLLADPIPEMSALVHRLRQWLRARR